MIDVTAGSLLVVNFTYNTHLCWKLKITTKKNKTLTLISEPNLTLWLSLLLTHLSDEALTGSVTDSSQ